MNDFLRPCNCVHPADEDCERCMNEPSQEQSPGKDCCCETSSKEAAPSAPASAS